MTAGRISGNITTRVARAPLMTAIFVVLGILLTSGVAQARTLPAPGLRTPASNATVQELPAFEWGSVRGAAKYQFEFSAVRNFASPVNGFASGPESVDGTAITNGDTIPNGTYYWRVRAVTVNDRPGRWSGTRTLHKSWDAAPTLLSPQGATVRWPSNPLVLKWSSVPYAAKYDVFIGADPSLSHLVYGSVSSPLQIAGLQLAFPGLLASGTYYWAIQPVDANGVVGKRSAVASFNWSWPSDTNATEVDDSSDPSVVEPRFSWSPIAGAAGYEVEVSRAYDFPQGSDVLDQKGVIGDSFSPTSFLPNETTLYWRVRAEDAEGDAGDWNVGQPFTESFDQLPPTIQNLRLVDGTAAESTMATGSSTSDPTVTWSPVPGASSYDVQVAPFASGFGCEWSSIKTVTQNTASTAWTPASANPIVKQTWEPPGWPPVSAPPTNLTSAGSYCVRVAAIRDDLLPGGGTVVSATTQLGGQQQPSYSYTPPSAGIGTLQPTPSSAYVLPAAAGTVPTETATPVFSWNPVSGASGYYVVISRDQAFTNVVSVAATDTTSYAPVSPLADETSAYFWEVVPSSSQGVNSDPQDGIDNPQAFNKSSIPPSLIGPGNNATVDTQPTFQWTSALGARNYTLQIAGDPSFANPVDQVTTDQTSYTTNDTLPADRTLYWRVRANDSAKEGLNWSGVSTFTHHLPAPTSSPTNPTSGSGLPLEAWAPVPGAESYNWFLEQPDGTTKSGSIDTPWWTPIYWYGTGIWRSQLQAVYPGGATSAYSSAVSFAHTLPAPTGARGTKSGNQVVISWSPIDSIGKYQVQLSTTPGFASPVASTSTKNTVWAAQVSAATATQKLYWRVAAIDEYNNVGAYDRGVFRAPPKPKKPHKPKKHKSKHKGKSRPKGKKAKPKAHQPTRVKPPSDALPIIH